MTMRLKCFAYVLFLMQGRIRAALWVFPCLCLCAACLPDPLEVKNIPAPQPEIVVSSQLLRGESLVVLLTRTIGALDASDNSDPEALIDQIAVNDATVVIQGPVSIDTLLFLEYGLYGGVDIDFLPGDMYSLYVNSASLGEVTATTTVQEQVQFDSFSASLYYNAFNDTLAQITYSINDPPAKNYYMLNVQEVEREDVIENIINPGAFTRLVNDADFQGTTYSEEFRVFPRDYQPGDTIAVSLTNISEEYYTFMKLRMDNRLSLVQFLGEPVNYPSNVNGGKGFFNLFMPDIRFFVFRE